MSNSRKGPPDTAAGKDEQQTPASQAGGAGDSPEKPKAEAAGSEKGKEQGQDKAADGARTEADDAARQKPQAGKSSAEKASAARTGVENADAAPAAQAAGEAAQTPRRSGWGRMVTNILLALILLVLLIAGTIYVAWPSLPAGLRTALSPARLLSTDTLDAAQARIDALEVRIAELEAKTAQPAAPVTGVAPQTLSALDERMAKLEGILSTLEQSVGSDRTVSNLQGRLDGLSDRTQAMSETLARIERDGATADDIAALRERVQGAAERIDALDKRVNSIDDIAANIADRTRLLERQMAETPTSDGMRLSALVLSAGQLKTAIQSGRSFVGELAAIKALGGDEPLVAEALAPLDSHAGCRCAHGRDAGRTVLGTGATPDPGQARQRRLAGPDHGKRARAGHRAPGAPGKRKPGRWQGRFGRNRRGHRTASGRGRSGRRDCAA